MIMCMDRSSMYIRIEHTIYASDIYTSDNIYAYSRIYIECVKRVGTVRGL